MSTAIPFPGNLFKPATGYPANVRFRLLRESDFLPLYTDCYSDQPLHRFRETFDRSLWRQANGRGLHLIAQLLLQPESEIHIIGSGQLIVYPYSAEIASVVVADSYRGQGIGTALITVLVAITRHLDFSSVEIGVLASNTRALALYRRLGFVEDRRIQLPGDAESSIILCKEL